MAEPLKAIFSPKLLRDFAADVQKIWPPFSTQNFVNQIFTSAWESLELKQRIRHISHVMRANLPPEYPEALSVIVNTTQRYLDEQGEKMAFEHLFLPDFVEIHGLEHPEISLEALETITRWISAEFAIRPFLLRYPEQTQAKMLVWSEHPSPMVRRLSTEGSRPRLPWGMGIPALKRDPSPNLPILERLKNDSAETVRRSVANHLNDITKDHPALALDLAERWLGQSPETDWVVRHACRGLLKKGNARALAFFGFQKGIEAVEIEHFTCPAEVVIGERLDFDFVVKNESQEAISLRLEYGIDYQTLSGKISRKVFKIKELNLGLAGSETIARSQRFQDFTTRKHYPGLHVLRILVNGVALAEREFEVRIR